MDGRYLLVIFQFSHFNQCFFPKDNAGTFDQLFARLSSESMYIVAIDLPGHGFSSHLPKGVPYTDLTWVIAIRQVLEFLNWKSNVTIIAHSMGALASLDFAALYPEIVTRLVMIDTIKPRIYESDQLAKESMESISLFLRTQNISNKPNYSFDVDKAINVITQTHYNGNLTKNAAFCLMQRAVDFQPNGTVKFRRDPRLNCIIRRKFEKCQLKNYLNNLKCQLMILRARNTHHTLKCKHDQDFIEFYRKKCSKFQYHEIDGDHYVHLIHPSNVALLIDDFINNAQ